MSVESIAMADPIARVLGSWSVELNLGSVLLRIGLSFFFAALVGCERANKRHAAGLRTFILVSVASTAAAMLDAYAALAMRSSHMLLSAASVIAVAIISSSAILYSSKNQIKGLTTAMALWSCGIIGLCIGGGFYMAALLCFTALLCCLSLLPAIEVRLKDSSNHFEIQLELQDKKRLHDFLTTIRALGLQIDDIEANPAYINSGLSVFTISLTITGQELKKYKRHDEIITALGSLEYVCFIEEIK